MYWRKERKEQKDHQERVCSQSALVSVTEAFFKHAPATLPTPASNFRSPGLEPGFTLSQVNLTMSET